MRVFDRVRHKALVSKFILLFVMLLSLIQLQMELVADVKGHHFSLICINGRGNQGFLVNPPLLLNFSVMITYLLLH